MHIFFWIAIVVMGIGVATEATGHHISFSNSQTPELTTSSQTLPTLEPEQSIQTPKPSPTVAVTPKIIKASDKSLLSATYIFTAIKGEQRTEFINKFSNGKNDLALAINNLAILLDSKPELLASVEKFVNQDLTNRKSEEELEYHKKEYQRLKELNDSFSNSSSSNGSIGGTYDTNGSNDSNSLNNQWSGLSKQTQTQPVIPPQNTYGDTVRYDVIGDSVYGNDGSRYDKIGDSIYKNDGTRYDIIGDSIYGNDGSRYDQIGDTTYKNDGTRYDAIGDTIYGSDGSRYYNIGDSIYAQPGN